MRYLLTLENFKTLKDFPLPGYSKFYKTAFSLDDKEAIKKFEPIRKQLEKDCSKFIQEIKETNSNIFWRGYGAYPDEDDVIKSKKVRKDRNPRDIETQIQEVFDFYFERHFGVKLRSSGVFTTKEFMAAETYGTPCLFFPKGDYEYYWSVDVRDLYSDFEDSLLANYYINRRDSLLEEIFEDEWNDLNSDNYEVDKWIEEEWFNKKSLEAIEMFEDEVEFRVREYKKGKMEKINDEEVIFICDEYYIVNPNYLRFVLDMFGFQLNS